MKITDKMIGDWLVEKRTKRGMTQQEVADKLGCTRVAVHSWETAKRSMYAETLFAYCKAIDADPNDLIPDIMRKL